MEFVGKALLLEVSSYQSKDDGAGEATDKFKYVFLVGDQKGKGCFIENAHVESCVSDHILLNGDEKVFDEIDVAVTVKVFKQRINGVLQDVARPMYQVVDKVGH